MNKTQNNEIKINHTMNDLEYSEKETKETYILKMIENTIRYHEKYSKSFFWNPSSTTSGRRFNESRFSVSNPKYIFTFENKKYEVNPSYSESCKNIYYHLSIYVDGIKKNITTLKSVFKKLK